MFSNKKILVATDFAEPSRAAADVGLELAQTLHVPLVLVHAFLVPSYIYTGVPFVPLAECEQAYEDAARDLLEKERARLADKGADVTSILRVGVAWQDSLATARQIDAGLIVMGTHGRQGLPRALLGSVAEKVVRLSPVPVLTIHGAEPPRASEGKNAAEVKPKEGSSAVMGAG